MAHEIQRLQNTHMMLIDLALAGYKVKEIAEAMNRTPQSVSMLLQSPLVQAELTRKRNSGNFAASAQTDRERVLGRARSVLEQSAEKAALTQVALLESEDHSVRHRSAQAILDRALGRTEERGASVVVNVSAEQVQLLQLAMQESPYGQKRQLPAADRSSVLQDVSEQTSPAWEEQPEYSEAD